MRRGPLCFALLAACASPHRTEDPARFICEACLGPLAPSGVAVEVKAPYWKGHRLFRLTNYTWPHIPGCYVALAPDRKILILAGRGDRVETDDPIGNFNRIAVREQVHIDEGGAGAYMRFFAECYIASFAPERYTPQEGAFLYRDWSGRVTRYEVTVHRDGTVEVSSRPAPA